MNSVVLEAKKEQNETIENLAKGRIDIIGTHRLLSKDVKVFWFRAC